MKRHFKFPLVHGATRNSTQARSTLLSAICRQPLAVQHEIEIVDVLKEPKRALRMGVYMTPRHQARSDPVQKLFGNLSETETVLLALGVEIIEA